MGGPPGIPGNPLPAEPNVPGFVELGMVPIACTTEGEDAGATGTTPIPPIPFCRLREDGFCGFGEGETFCARTEDVQMERTIGRASRRTRIIEASLSCTWSLSEHAKHPPGLVVREAGIEPARHC